MNINCIIVDDEPLAVDLIADYASKIVELKVLYKGSDVYEAMDIINNDAVDLIFLDIQMPKLSGLELMQLFNQNQNFIITSAYPEFALDTYQFNVIDFLLKPITFNRFFQGFQKYKSWQENFQNTKTTEFLLVKSDRKFYQISIDSIQFIEGLKDYIQIHTDSEKIIVLENLKDILNKLPKNQFLRIHRSYIVSKSKLKIIEGNRVKMKSGDYLPIGKTYRNQINQWTENI